MSVNAVKLDNSTNLYRLDQMGKHNLEEVYMKLEQRNLQNEDACQIQNIYILRSFRVQVWRMMPDKTQRTETVTLNHCKEKDLSRLLGYEVTCVAYSEDGIHFLPPDARTDNVYRNLRIGDYNVIHVK